MASIQQVSMTAPNDFDIARKQLERQRQMAQALQQQAFQPMDQGQTVSGIYVAPSWTQGLAKMLQGYVGRKSMEDADQKEKDITTRSNQALVEGLQNYQKTLQGTPERTVSNDASGDETVTMPAQPGNRQAALAQLLQSNHPALQQMGMAAMLKTPETAFGKVDPKDYTPESVAKFAASGNYADLMPVRKMEIAPSGVVYNPYGAKEGTVFNDPNKIMGVGADGAPVVNQPLVAVKKDIAKAGAANVQVKTDVKTGESLAGQVGPMMKDSTTAAEGAVKQVDAAQRIVKAVDTGNIMAGPGATTKLKLAQVGDAMGIGGKDTEEKIANTRQTIRGLAELTLQGRQQMRGQGAITESEGALAEKAMSGNIDDLTPAEIRMLAKASERAARFNYAEHQRKLKVMQQNPALQGIAPFYQGPEMPAEAAPAPVAPSNNGWSIKPR